jgi:hypothetical protein
MLNYDVIFLLLSALIIYSGYWTVVYFVALGLVRRVRIYLFWRKG